MKLKRLEVAELKEELNDISSYHRMLKSKNVLEKLLWISIALCGTGFIFHIVQNQLIYWNENQVLITKKSVALSEIEKPAVTYCNKALHKYGVAEKILNYYNGSEEVMSMRNEILSSYLQTRVNPREACMDIFGDFNFECVVRKILSLFL